MKSIYEQPEEDRLEFALDKYLQILNKEIVQYFLVAHCWQYYMFSEFDNIDIEKCSIKLISVSCSDIFNKIDYANFCSFKNESKDTFEMLDSTGYDYWPNGSWSAPIIVVERDQKLVAVDGNNRLRMLRTFLKYSKKKKSLHHSLYLIQENLE